MKVSEITVDTLIEYGNYYEQDKEFLEELLKASLSFIKNYTGLTEETIKDKEDLTVVVMSIVSDMYENRTFTANNLKPNPLIESILGAHCINLI